MSDRLGSSPSDQSIDILDRVEIEDYGKQNAAPPPAKLYIIRIDKEKKEVATSVILGRDILALVGKTPEGYKLYEHIHGNQPVQIAADKEVDLRAPGVERFTTMPRDTTEGLSSGRRMFRLPEADEEHLNRMGVQWETISEGQTQWLLIHGWGVPAGYDYERVSLALLIPSGYADSEIHMVYVKPGLSRTDGKPIGALSNQQIDGEAWQRWSRHRTAANPWRRGIDDVPSHLGLVDEWFRREFEKP